MVKYAILITHFCLLFALSACTKTESPTPDVAAAPAPTPQALDAQAQQLMALQIMQMQQQVFNQNLRTAGQLGAHVGDSVYQQGVTNACYLAGNCEVRLVPNMPVGQ
jgi:hypothetical protein